MSLDPLRFNVLSHDKILNCQGLVKFLEIPFELWTEFKSMLEDLLGVLRANPEGDLSDGSKPEDSHGNVSAKIEVILGLGRLDLGLESAQHLLATLNNRSRQHQS
mmetsp:Transcript_88368/g.234994  ORF Transcript_88368/g.234994 Transcript_88368/m.234994 type:complete len:105 (+) Transcript_88368:84-398(+)